LDDRVDVGVLGATGAVGQRLIGLLENHPWFRLGEVCGSAASVGKTLSERLGAGADRFSPEVAGLRLQAPDAPWTSSILLSALPSEAAQELEVQLAEAGHLVVSNASSHRMGTQVPLIIPEVNSSHLDLIADQPWTGALVTNPNCAAVGLVMALAPLHETFGVESVVTTSFQSISGAGLPGPPAATLVDNVIPFIDGEEHKLTCEPQKILGTVTPEGLEPATFPVSASCTRVAVLDGHLMAVSVALAGQPSLEDVTAAFEEYRGSEACRGLPSAPERPLQVLVGDDRPQPRLDRDLGQGMTVSVGRIRPCEVLSTKFFVLSHNLVRGAAGAALLNAELCHAQGVLASS
jgi:aspartate-semialdehyde dehydrogenase